MQYGTKLKETRTDLDMTQAQVAQIIGTTFQQIYKYESNRQEMTGTRLKEFCELYQVSADYILGLPKDLAWPMEE